MSDTVEDGGTVEDNSSEITLQEINRNASKKVRRNTSEGDLPAGGQGEPQRHDDVVPGDVFRENAVVHERLTGTAMYVYMWMVLLFVIVFVSLAETSKAFTQLHVDASRHNEKNGVDLKRLESVGDDTRQYSGAPPSTKKRKAGSQSGTAQGSRYSLTEMLAHFGDIQLNKDFYDSIERTESRCDIGSENVRENDRKAFNTALETIEECLQEAVDTADHSEQSLFLDDIDFLKNRNGVLKAFCLITISLEVIQFLMDLGGGTSTSASLTIDETDSVVRSLSKSTSQNINIKEKHSVVSDGDEGQSPLKPSQMNHGKHPRQRHQEDIKETCQPSEVASLVSNDPPKRQRKYEDEVSSRLPSKQIPEEEGKDSLSSPAVSIQEEHSPNESGRQKSAEHKSSTQLEGDRSNPEPQDRWGSSLVCADLSLTEVGSKIYWPFLSSLRAAGVVNLPHDKESFETIISAYSDTIEGSGELADSIHRSVESIYRNFDIQTNTTQKALGLVAAAFERILASYIKDISHPS